MGLRRIASNVWVLEAGAKIGESHKGPWVKLTWDEADALRSALKRVTLLAYSDLSDTDHQAIDRFFDQTERQD